MTYQTRRQQRTRARLLSIAAVGGAIIGAASALAGLFSFQMASHIAHGFRPHVGMDVLFAGSTVPGLVTAGLVLWGITAATATGAALCVAFQEN
jgi:hypothetical protein